MGNEEEDEERTTRPGYEERSVPVHATEIGTREAVGAADFTFGPTFATAPTASWKIPMLIGGAGVPDFMLASGFARTSAPTTTLDDCVSKGSGGVGASDFAVLTSFAEAPTTTRRGEGLAGRGRRAGEAWEERGWRRGWVGGAAT